MVSIEIELFNQLSHPTVNIFGFVSMFILCFILSWFYDEEGFGMVGLLVKGLKEGSGYTKEASVEEKK